MPTIHIQITSVFTVDSKRCANLHQIRSERDIPLDYYSDHHLSSQWYVNIFPLSIKTTGHGVSLSLIILIETNRKALYFLASVPCLLPLRIILATSVENVNDASTTAICIIYPRLHSFELNWLFCSSTILLCRGCIYYLLCF